MPAAGLLSPAVGTPIMVGGVYNATTPMLQDKQGSMLNLDNEGNLLVSVVSGGGGGGGNVNVIEWASTALGAPSAFGTSPGAVNVIGTNAELFAGSTALTATGSSLNVNITGGGSGGTQYTDGTAESAGAFIGTVALGYNGTSVVGLRLDASNNLLVDLNTALPAGSNIIGKVDILGNAGATLDSTIGAAIAPTNALATSVVYQTTIPSLTAGQAVAVQSDVTGSTYVDIEGRKPTYSAFASFAPPSLLSPPTAGDVAVLPGSASKTIRITRVEVSLSTSGTAQIDAVQLVKRSSADSGGTSVAMTAVPHDSQYGAATAVPLAYTTAPVEGAAVGIIRGVQFNDASGSSTGTNTWIWTFGDGRGGASGIVLRGTAQQLTVNLSATVVTQVAAISFEWTEDNS